MMIAFITNYPKIEGVFFIVLGVVVLWWILKIRKSQKTITGIRAIYGAILAILLGLTLLFGL
jgi:hypothetical protein